MYIRWSKDLTVNHTLSLPWLACKLDEYFLFYSAHMVWLYFSSVTLYVFVFVFIYTSAKQSGVHEERKRSRHRGTTYLSGWQCAELTASQQTGLLGQSRTFMPPASVSSHHRFRLVSSFPPVLRLKSSSHENTTHYWAGGGLIGLLCLLWRNSKIPHGFPRPMLQ